MLYWYFRTYTPRQRRHNGEKSFWMCLKYASLFTGQLLTSDRIMNENVISALLYMVKLPVMHQNVCKLRLGDYKHKIPPFCGRIWETVNTGFSFERVYHLGLVVSGISLAECAQNVHQVLEKRIVLASHCIRVGLKWKGPSWYYIYSIRSICAIK